MTEEEKREFEEFLQWKKEKEAAQNAANVDQDAASSGPIDSDNLSDQNKNGIEPETSESNSTGNVGIFLLVIAALICLIGLVVFVSNKKDKDMASVEEDEIVEEVLELSDTILTPSEPTSLIGSYRPHPCPSP